MVMFGALAIFYLKNGKDKKYVRQHIDCLRLAISLGGDSDTLAAISGPMAYALYREMPAPLVYQALKSLPDWMQRVNTAFDQRCEELGTLG